MELDEAYSLISRAIDTGHAAHGYLIVGDVRGNGAELVDRILLKLFPDEPEQVAAHTHPDVLTLEPQGRSRTIKVEKTKEDKGPGMRDGMIEPMAASSFSGGWKVGVISEADRMQLAAANALLKSLEEPTPRTLYLLLTDQPDSILPTIRSRTQRIDLPRPEDLLDGETYETVATAFAAKDASALAAVFHAIKEEADETDLALVRKRFFRTLMSFARRLMVGGKVPRALAYRNVEAVEDAYRQSEKYLPDDAVLSFLTDRITLPK